MDTQPPFLTVLSKLAPGVLQLAVWNACMSRNWYFGNQSVAAHAAVPFWKMNLVNVAAADQLWDVSRPVCESATHRTLKVVRQYANGHTYGQGGQPHRDDSREGTFTLLYYPMLEWQPEWEGETLFFDDRRQIIRSITPVPNSAILFDSRTLHAGRAPSRSYSGLRVTVAFKLESTELADTAGVV